MLSFKTSPLLLTWDLGVDTLKLIICLILIFHFQGTLVDTLREAQPTIFFGVPRIYEKMKERIEERSEQIRGLKRRLSNWAMKKGLKGNLRRQNSTKYILEAFFDC